MTFQAWSGAAPMCRAEPTIKMSRTLQLSGGKIIQCLSCDCVGVEFGTSYLVFGLEEFERFVNWFLSSTLYKKWEIQDGRARLCLGDSSLMLSLREPEIRALAVLLEEGRTWIRGSPKKLSPREEDHAYHYRQIVN